MLARSRRMYHLRLHHDAFYHTSSSPYAYEFRLLELDRYRESRLLYYSLLHTRAVTPIYGCKCADGARLMVLRMKQALLRRIGLPCTLQATIRSLSV